VWEADDVCGARTLDGWNPVAAQWRAVGEAESDLLESRVPRPSFAWAGLPCYSNRMAKSKKFDLGNPVPVVDDEDEETLAAIGEGIRDAEAGRTVPAEEVRRLLPKWTSGSSTR